MSALFWLIFSITGVNLFKGKFYKCVYSNNGSIVKNLNITGKEDCTSRNDTVWVNSKINFDNTLKGYLALFELATFEGWQEIIADGVDSTKIDFQPSREAEPWTYAYFIAFIMFGTFFTLNLFFGILIQNFTILHKKVMRTFINTYDLFLYHINA